MKGDESDLFLISSVQRALLDGPGFGDLERTTTMLHTETDIYPSSLPLVRLILGTINVRMHLPGVLGYSLLACLIGQSHEIDGRAHMG